MEAASPGRDATQLFLMKRLPSGFKGPVAVSVKWELKEKGFSGLWGAAPKCCVLDPVRWGREPE